MTPRQRVRFWHADLLPERARLLAAPAPSRDGFVVVGRRRRIGHNSWLHDGARDAKTDTAAWMAPADLARLGLVDGAVIELATATGRLRLPVQSRDGVPPGTVVVPHGTPDVNVNALLPAGPQHIEPISGTLRMTGQPVTVRPVREASIDAR